MRFWWLSAVGWLVALELWFQELVVLVLARVETEYAEWKLFLLVFLWIVIVFSFFHAIFKPPASIPKQFACTRNNYQQKAKELNVNIAKYCNKCMVLKPNRAHHCSVCNRCVLRMDHHCPVLQVCVHHGNHKFYLLYLIWPGTLGFYAIYLCFPCVYRTVLLGWYTEKEISYTLQFIVGAMINAGTIVAAVIYLLHTQLPNILYNRTIIEQSTIGSIEEGESWLDYAKTTRTEDISAVMGSPWSWLLPVDNVPGDGIQYEYKWITEAERD